MGFPALRSDNWGGNAIMDNPSVLTITCDTASFSVTGTDATLLLGNIPLVVSVNYDWNRNYPRAFHPSLRKPIRIAVPTAAIFAASGTSYSWTGTDATFSTSQLANSLNEELVGDHKTFPRQFAPGPWGHLTTQRSFNRIGPAGLAQLLFVANAGAYSLSGGVANLAKNAVFNADVGTYVWTGTAASLGGSAILTNGSYTVIGPPASLKKGSVVDADRGVYVLSGTDANLKFSLLAANSGTYVINGSSANIHTGLAFNSSKPNHPTLARVPTLKNNPRR